MDEFEFTDPKKTVYKYDQVITEDDLYNFREHLLWEFMNTPLEKTSERMCLDMSIRTADTFIEWIKIGKKRDYEGLI